VRSSDGPEFDPVGALRLLTERRVEFVLIGGFAARLLGSPSVTFDLDICYARHDGNLDRLAAVLQELHAELRGAPRGLSLILDAKTLHAGDHFTFDTLLGPLDVLGVPAGTDGYEDLARTALRTDLGGFEVLVSSIDDLIRMKRAAGRPKDRVELEILGALRDELDLQGSERVQRKRPC